MLSLNFNTMLPHGHVSHSFLDTIIIPLVKDKKESLESGNNYRPITITSTLSKVLEMIIPERYKIKLESSPHQFGYKTKHGTELSIFVLKQVIEHYQTHCNPMYLCFMDLSKAFSRVDHVTLFRKLQKYDQLSLVIRLLKNWCATQKCYVQWESALSDCFKSVNGVRQGGILTPLLFNVYVEEVSAHNNILRLFYKLRGGPGTSTSHHFVTMDIPNLDIIRRRLVSILHSRVFSSHNCIVMSIVDSIFLQ